MQCSHHHSHLQSMYAHSCHCSHALFPGSSSPSLQNPMHPSRTNSNAMSPTALSSASWCKINGPAHGVTCHFSTSLVYFYHHFHVCFPWVIVDYSKVTIMPYNLCIPNTFSMLPGNKCTFSRRSSFLTFTLHEILKPVLKKFLGMFLVWWNPKFED